VRARPARLGDAPAIAPIYNAGIAERTATFETTPRTAKDVAAWFERPQPIVVVEEEGSVIAFAAASPYHPGRECYAGIAEFSVYAAPEARGRGAGRLAMAELITACELAGLWKLLSRVFVENEASRRLLRGLGFREVGIYRRHGRIDGVWHDVVIVELLLGEAAAYQTPMPQ
jgi:L-amino acid N-acyltransferase YncA